MLEGKANLPRGAAAAAVDVPIMLKGEKGGVVLGALAVSDFETMVSAIPFLCLSVVIRVVPWKERGQISAVMIANLCFDCTAVELLVKRSR